MSEHAKHLRWLSSLESGQITTGDLLDAADHIDALEAALAALLDDVESGVDFGVPFNDPDNNFHDSVMTARRVLGKTQEPEQEPNSPFSYR